MNKLIKAADKAFIEWRHHLHAYPELAYQEHRTSAFVTDRLREFGCEVHTGLAETGVVGILDFGEGPTIGIRADMDALPLREKTDLPYASRVDGVMHACGHDGHTTMALGAAKLLAERNDLRGKIVFIFQPAEENEGGAKRMLDDGLFHQHPVDAVFGLHNLPGIPVEEVWVKAGVVSASFDTFEIQIKGRGGHGAMPEKALDPIPAAASAVLSLNTIVSRDVPPLASAVLSVCSVNAGSTFNVIPDEARITGSCRSLDPEVQLLMQRRIGSVVKGLEASFGVQTTCELTECYPPVINTPQESELIKTVVRNAGRDLVLREDFDPLMGSEDFSFFLQQRPGCFFVIGNGMESGPLHSPTYQFDDAALPIGVGLWVELAERYLSGR